MKNKYLKVRLLLIVGMVLTSSNILAGDFPEKGDAARGAKAWSENCMRCHNLRDSHELRDDQWITTTFHMRIRGNLTGQETRDILTFLQSSN